MPILQFAVAGCGRMGQYHARRVTQSGRAAVTAAFDPAPAAVAELSRSLPNDCRAMDSFDDLLRQSDIDALIIATPTTCHREQLLAAAERGWHILCEKPLAGNRADICELMALPDHFPDQHFMLGYQRRHWTVYRRMRDEVRSSQWGQIRAVTQTNSEKWQPTIAGTWRDDPAMNFGGFLGDAGSHKLDIVFFVTGLAPRDVYAVSDQRGSHVDVLTALTARLDGNVPFAASFVGCSGTFQESLTIHCESADLILQDWQFWLGRDNQRICLEAGTDGFARESPRSPVDAFLDLLEGIASNEAPLECALPVFDFTAAILESARTGQRISVNAQR